MKKVFLIFLFLFISFDLHGSEILPAENILSQLKYKPDWDNQPTTKDIMDAFEKDTGWNYHFAKEKCIKYYSDIDYFEERKYYDCKRIDEEKIFLKQEGNKLSCKRKDFIRPVILEGSNWLLERDWPKYVYDDWYYKLKSPFHLYESEDDLVCKTFSEKYDCLYDKHSFDDLKSTYNIEEIAWDFDVAKSRAEIEFEQNNEDEDINNKDNENRKLCSNPLFIENTRLLEIDIDNDGKNELIHLVWEPDNTYGAVYDKNIDRIKRYLKNKRLIIKNEEHYLKIARKFRGISITKESSLNDSSSYFYIPNFNINFLKINNRIYVYYNNISNISVITITNDKIDNVCKFKRSYISLYESDFDVIGLEKKIAEIMGLSYINDDNYLYDISLLEEINNVSSFLTWYDEEDIRKLKQYLFDNALKVCNIDLGKLEKEQRKTLSSEEILSKLKYKPDWNSYPTIDDFRKKLEKLEEKVLEREPSSIVSDYRQTTDYKEKRDKITDFYDYYNMSVLLKEYYDDHIYYNNRGKRLSCKRKDFFRSIVLEGSSWLLDRDWSKEVYDDWFYNLRSPFALDHEYIEPEDDVCNAFAREEECIGTKELTGKPLKKIEKIKKYNWDYDVVKTQREISFADERPPLQPQKKVCSNFLNQDKYDVYSNWHPFYTEDFFSLRRRTFKDSQIIEIDFNNDGKKELIYLAYDDPQTYRGVFFDNIEEIKKILKTSDQIVKVEEWFKDILKKFNGLDITDELCYFSSKSLSSYDINLSSFFHKTNPYVFNFFEFNNKNYFYFNSDDVYVIYKNKDGENIVSCVFDGPVCLFNLKKMSHDYIKKVVAENIPLFHLNNDEYFYAEDLLEEARELILRQAPLESKDFLFNKAQEICGIDLYELEKEQREPE